MERGSGPWYFPTVDSDGADSQPFQHPLVKLHRANEMKRLKICINTQTPPVRFMLSEPELTRKYGKLEDPLRLSKLVRGVDYDYSPGGVTASVPSLVERMMSDGFIRDPVWISLGINYPSRALLGRMTISHLELDVKGLKEYSTFKETLWQLIHGLGDAKFSSGEYLGYVRYNWANADALLRRVDDVDAYFIQDFQLLLTGQLIGVSAPAVLRWHVPFRPENLGRLRRFILKAIEGFDSVVVSTRRDLEGLIRTSYHGHAHQIYPNIDPAQWPRVPDSATDRLRARIGLKEDQEMLLMVARMDPIKSQDVAIRALARLKSKRPKLLFIGNGSFSSSKSGGIGHNKAALWQKKLQILAKDLKVSDQVVFLGHATDEELKSAYALSSATLLPSAIEGFGLTTVESWVNKKPVVVSKGAGASELVVEGSNGFTFEPGDDATMADGILKSLGTMNEKLGENGFETAKQCFVGEASEKVRSVLEQAMAGY